MVETIQYIDTWEEYTTFLTNPPPWLVHIPEVDDLFNFKLYIQGPSNTPYEYGIFGITLVIPHNYPFRPPKIKFQKDPYHPIQTDDYCHCCCPVPTLNSWNPQIKLEQLLENFIEIFFTYPEKWTCAGQLKILKEILENPDEFAKKARNWTKINAYPDPPKKPSLPKVSRCKKTFKKISWETTDESVKSYKVSLKKIYPQPMAETVIIEHSRSHVISTWGVYDVKIALISARGQSEWSDVKQITEFHWTRHNVYEWAKGFVKRKYAKVLKKNKINGKLLFLQTKADLISYGINRRDD